MLYLSSCHRLSYFLLLVRTRAPFFVSSIQSWTKLLVSLFILCFSFLLHLVHPSVSLLSKKKKLSSPHVSLDHWYHIHIYVHVSGRPAPVFLHFTPLFHIMLRLYILYSSHLLLIPQSVFVLYSSLSSHYHHYHRCRPPLSSHRLSSSDVYTFWSRRLVVFLVVLCSDFDRVGSFVSVRAVTVGRMNILRVID